MARSGFMAPFLLLDEHPGIDDEVLAAWFRCVDTCSRAMNGGRLVGARVWKPLGWTRIVGITCAAALNLVAAGLARWEGDDLVLGYYDLHGEVVYRAKSEGGRLGNVRKWSAGSTPTKESDQDSDKESDQDSRGKKRRSPNRRSVAERSVASTDGSSPSPSSKTRGDGEYHPTADTPPDGSPAVTTTATTASGNRQGGTAAMAKRRVEAIDPEVVRASIRSGLFDNLLRAFGLGSTLPLLRGEWLLAADESSLGDLALVLWWRWNTRDPVRLPTGLRQARASWLAQPADERTRAAGLMRTWLGRTEAVA